MKSSDGRTGCGCLIVVLVVSLITAALMIHPFSLRLLGDRLVYRDPMVASDVIVIPYFPEDRNGELIMDAFREFWAGNGKLILVEEQRVFGLSLTELVQRLARERGIKDPVVRKLDVDAERAGDPDKLREKVSRLNFKKVIVMVPDYASRRFHAVFGGSKDKGDSIYLIRPVVMSYFTRERWWRNAATRRIAVNEIYGTLCFYASGFTRGKNQDKQ